MARSHETEVVISCDDDVINETDAQQIAALAKPLGDLDVFRARIRASTRVIVAYENGLGVADYGAFERFARMNDRCRKRPDTARHENQIRRTRADRLVGDVDRAALGVSGARQHSADPSMAKASATPGRRATIIAALIWQELLRSGPRLRTISRMPKTRVS